MNIALGRWPVGCFSMALMVFTSASAISMDIKGMKATVYPVIEQKINEFLLI